MKAVKILTIVCLIALIGAFAWHYYRKAAKRSLSNNPPPPVSLSNASCSRASNVSPGYDLRQTSSGIWYYCIHNIHMGDDYCWRTAGPNGDRQPGIQVGFPQNVTFQTTEPVPINISITSLGAGDEVVLNLSLIHI